MIIYIDRTLRQEFFAITSWNAFHLLEFQHMHISWHESISKVLHVFVLWLWGSGRLHLQVLFTGQEKWDKEFPCCTIPTGFTPPQLLDRNVKFWLFLKFDLLDYSLKSIPTAPAFSLLFKAGLWFCNELYKSGNGRQVQYSEDLMRPNVLRQNFCI